LWVKPAGKLVYVVPRLEVRPGDVALVVLFLLAHIKELELRLGLCALGQALDLEALYVLHGPVLAAPLRHPTGQVATEPADSHGQRKHRCVASILVVASHEHRLLIAVSEPREARAKPGLERRDADRAGDVRL